MAHRLGRLACALCGLAWMVTRTASAADSGFYIDFDGGWVNYGGAVHWDSTTLVDPNGAENEFTWGFSGGYRFNRYASLDLGYVDLGRRSDLVRNPDNPTSSFGLSTFSAHGETLAAIGTLPLGKWDLFAKAGVLLADTHFDFSGTLSAEPFNPHFTIVNTHALFGAGAGYNFTKNWRLQLGFTSYRDVGSTDLSGGGRLKGPNLGERMLGVSYRF